MKEKKEIVLDDFGIEMPLDIVVDEHYDFKRLKKYKYSIKGCFFIGNDKMLNVLLLSIK